MSVTPRSLTVAALLVIAGTSSFLWARNYYRGEMLSGGAEAWEDGEFEKAHRILRPFAEEGELAAQQIIGKLYARGQGVARDEQEAMKWFRKLKYELATPECPNFSTAAILAYKESQELTTEASTLKRYCEEHPDSKGGPDPQLGGFSAPKCPSTDNENELLARASLWLELAKQEGIDPAKCKLKWRRPKIETS